MRNYTFRPLTEADLPLMRRWLAAAHVKVWWPDAEKQITLMEEDMHNPEIKMQVVSLIDHPFAYIHDHDARAFAMPSSMVSPSTNCRPRIFIDWPTAVRTTGSPSLRSRLRNARAGPFGSSSSTLPVSMSAQVEALTREDEE